MLAHRNQRKRGTGATCLQISTAQYSRGKDQPSRDKQSGYACGGMLGPLFLFGVLVCLVSQKCYFVLFGRNNDLVRQREYISMTYGTQILEQSYYPYTFLAKRYKAIVANAMLERYHHPVSFLELSSLHSAWYIYAASPRTEPLIPAESFATQRKRFHSTLVPLQTNLLFTNTMILSSVREVVQKKQVVTPIFCFTALSYGNFRIARRNAARHSNFHCFPNAPNDVRNTCKRKQ